MTTTEFSTILPATITVQPDIIKTLREYVIYQNISAGSASLNFNCNVQADGSCSNTVLDCCEGCNETFGWLKYIAESDLETYANLYDPVVGFYDSENGCKLPRNLRSSICNSYQCPSAKLLNSESDTALIDGVKMSLTDTEDVLKFTVVN